MRELAVRLEERQSHDFRRLLIVSAVLHVVAMLAMFLTPSGPTLAPPLGVRVQLVSMPSTAPAPAPKPAPAKPAPRPQPKPKSKPPKPAPVVLPVEAATPKPKPEPKSEPALVAKPEPKPKPEPPPQAPPQQEEYVDVLDQLRSELGEDTPPEAPPQIAQTGPIGTPDGVPVSAEVAAWLRAVKVHTRRNWVVPPAFEMQSLVTSIEVDLDASGNVRGEPSVAQRSGNPWYDENVVRSIKKASPMPAPPKAGKWTFVFRSDRD